MGWSVWARRGTALRPCLSTVTSVHVAVSKLCCNMHCGSSAARTCSRCSPASAPQPRRTRLARMRTSGPLSLRGTRHPSQAPLHPARPGSPAADSRPLRSSASSLTPKRRRAMLLRLCVAGQQQGWLPQGDSIILPAEMPEHEARTLCIEA